ncbi:MAG: NADH-quinone oxidoreductase subunit L [Gammaproteobacteria bacterium]|nr:MAG: NADH-quinone oxidoreductase subunit L [Gammaproteobacteria bacterium]
MFDYLWLVPTLPLLGFLALVFIPLPDKLAAAIGYGSVGLAFLVVLAITKQFLDSPPDNGQYVLHLWTWMRVGEFQPAVAFHLDGLTLVMLNVITGVGFLIHCYSAGYMHDDASIARYFAYLNLFVCAMLILVLADNLLFMFLGWEGVGLCSYLLIGFWYKEPENGAAARKAFVVTRIGDTAMAIGLFLLFTQLNTLNMQEVAVRAPALWPQDSTMVTVIALLLLGGAVGKSAQLPLQTWLPDAMAGPTPVSALIHAATMVTAGVYLVARTHALFELSTVAQTVVVWVGLLTLLLAGLSAITQTDIKRILAYSTISQIGYMFLGLGVGAWSASIFHLMTHAFFKALLFLAAGSVIFCLHHKQDIFEMGGLWKKLPLTFISFVIGCACLAGFPYTSGFFSKDEILLGAYYSKTGGPLIFAGGAIGALITAIYSFRLIFIVFFGESKTEPDAEQSKIMQIPLVILSGLAIVGGLFHLPLEQVLPVGSHELAHDQDHLGLTVVLWVIPLLGIAIAYAFFYAKWFNLDGLNENAFYLKLQHYWRNGWGFDWVYDHFIVLPFKFIADINRADIIDSFYGAVVVVTRQFHRMSSATQTGSTRWYTACMVVGLIFTLLVAVIL